MGDNPREMLLRSIRVPSKHIGYLKWLLESHDGLATPTTRDEEPDVVDLLVSPNFIDDLEELITALEDELGAVRVTSPERSPL